MNKTKATRPTNVVHKGSGRIEARTITMIPARMTQAVTSFTAAQVIATAPTPVRSRSRSVNMRARTGNAGMLMAMLRQREEPGKLKLRTDNDGERSKDNRRAEGKDK